MHYTDFEEVVIMKLSMWILADWFAQYNPKCEIKRGEAGISGVRVFSEELPSISGEHLYVGRASEVFSDASYENTVLLVHGNDTMFLADISVEAALNEILAAFDYYNSWESRLWSATAKDDALQSIIDVADEVLSGPLSIADNDGNILARSMKYGSDDIDDRWKYVCEKRKTPLATTSAPIMTTTGELLTDWTNYPKLYWLDYGYRYIGGYLQADGETVAAFFFQELEKPLNPGDRQISAAMWQVIESALRGVRDIRARSSSSLLVELVSGASEQDAAAVKLDRQISGSKPWVLSAIRNIMSPENMPRKQRLLQILREQNPGCVSAIYGNDVLAVASYSNLRVFLGKLEENIIGRYYVVGISMPFSTWNDLPVRYNQAVFSISCADGKSGIYNAADYSFRQLLLNMKESNRALELLHPALELLRNYDEVHGAELCDTLFAYLRNERNIVATAAELFIHRNSMAYRVRRIAELTGADLDDFLTRAHILVSFLLDKGEDGMGA